MNKQGKPQLTEQQKKKMASYLIPTNFEDKRGNKEMKPQIFARIYKELKAHDYNNFVHLDILQDIIMEVYMKAYKKGKFLAPDIFVRWVKTYYWRRLNSEAGKKQDGGPLKTIRPVIVNGGGSGDYDMGTYGSYDIEGEYQPGDGIDTDPQFWYSDEYIDENEEEVNNG